MSKKQFYPLIITHLLILAAFTVNYVMRGNYEFTFYIGVILLLTWFVWMGRHKVDYPVSLLWGLVLWSLLHLSGGSVPVGDGVLYQWLIFPLSETLPILRFDQVVHAYGFGVTVFLVDAILRPILKVSVAQHNGLAFVVVMAALGLGALNEIVEFTATLVTPNTGVGGYVNNSLDLVFNLIGILIALFILRRRRT